MKLNLKAFIVADSEIKCGDFLQRALTECATLDLFAPKASGICNETDFVKIVQPLMAPKPKDLVHHPGSAICGALNPKLT